MHQTQHTTPCQVHAHPALQPQLIFEVRRLARDAGCQYVSRAHRRANAASAPSPFGGDAA
ncbi:MAG: hypothetical protein KJ884_02035 [Gammaproteobacteria bacterium]|uniref:Uncharacterized protein n=1 Tax=viral metagenome TaxID=1070528 RepID=A0A6M3J9T0_9ZZZZ|nr:hypothetical protein [Gammaproteobacteria bacterium]MBU1492244.1 hypothetical protein [Gammaproteobacteria bacterium]MBU2066815.1 hypothetical protein [Gammaproteobacteria bacterium]MBU2137369.1 hypothetical protein [Gammaproteobacteria bacterium]MBU2215070.1 hypothetical protein [Gammaproteobacteria bacterium]